MKRSILFSLLILLCSWWHAAAQSSLGIRGGLSIPNLTSGSGNRTPLNTGYKSRLGPDISLFTEFSVSNHFSLEPALEYASQGGKKNGLQAFTTPDQLAAMFPPGQAPPFLYANYKSEAKLNYLMLPILAKFSWKLRESAFRIYVDAGPFAALLVSAHQVTSGQSPFYADPAGQQPLPGGAQSFDNTENIKKDLHHFNVGIEGNIGLGYRFERAELFIQGGGNYGFLNIQKNAIDGKNNTGAAVVTIGYSYALGK